MNTKRLPHPIWLTAITLLLLVWLLPVRNGVTLRWLDQFSLYAPDIQGLPLSRQLPGGLLAEAGAYLSQLFFYPSFGCGVLFCVWALIVIIGWRLSRGALPYLFASVMLLAASILSIDFDWVRVYAPGYLFIPSLGLLFAVTSAWVISLLPWRTVQGVIAGLLPLCYIAVGVYAFIAWLLSLYVVKCKRYPVVLAGIILSVAVPILCRYFGLFTFTAFADIWYAPLPSSLRFLAAPAASVVVMALALSPLVKRTSPAIPVVGLLLWAGAAVWSVTASLKSEEFRALTRLHLYIDDGAWGRMVSLGRNLSETPSRDVAMLLNVANMHAGLQPLSVSDKAAGSYYTSTALVTVPVSVFYGRPNISYRWAMEHTVKYGHRAYYLKFMVRAALLNGEWALADRYLTLLENTMYHGNWAARYRRFLNRPDLIAADPEFAGIPADNSTEIFF